MSHAALFQFWISMFVYQLPALAVCLAAVIVILVKWKQSPRAALWALLGFGLILFIGIVMPVVQTAIQYWMFQNRDSSGLVRGSWAVGVVGIVWTVLHAVSYVFLLIAVFAGRPRLH
jgi:hypothetical protein